jgi:SHAQKYF class myb-like DNA-binding protein
MTADTIQPEEPAKTMSMESMDCDKPMPPFSGGLFGGTQIVSAPPPPLRVTDPKTPAPAEKEDAPCASVTSGSSEGSATPDGASDEENVHAPKLPALAAAADEAPADDATPEQAAGDAASDDDDKMVEKATTDEDGPTIELVPAAAEDGEDAADENDAAAEDADDATPEKAASDDDSPKPAKIPKPRGRAPQGKAWDPDQGRWATQVDESDDEETLDVMRQRASRSASVEEDVVRPARTESLEDVESRFLCGGATPPQKEQEDEPTPEKTSDDEPQPEKNENTGRWTDDEHARFLRGLELFGKKWSKVADVVQSRTTIQVRSHAQKYLKKFEEDSDDDEETLEAMRLKSQDRDYQLKRDEEREKKAQLRARQDLDQLSVKEFQTGDKVDARFGRGWFPGVVDKCIEGGYSIKWDEDSTYNDVLARDVRKRTADDDVSQAARALLAAKDDTILPSTHKVSAETSSEETLRWLDGFETRRWVERLVSSIDDASQQPKDEYAELSNSQLRALMRKNGIGRGSYDTRGDFVRKLRKHGVPPKEEPKEVVVKPVLLDTSKVQVGASVAKRFPGYGVYRGAIEAIDGDDVTVRWDDGDSVTWSRKEAARRVVKEAPTTKKVVKKPARRQPVVRPALVDVDDLLERDVRIQRTSKPRQARFERCTGATSAREYLRLGGQKKDLRYDVSNGFFVEVDVCSGVFCTFERAASA